MNAAEVQYDKHLGMPSAKAIDDYWEERDLPMSALRNDPGDCFACGLAEGGMWGCDRAHIDPDGGEGVENLHLLCKACHLQSEDLTGDAYWLWYRHRVRVSLHERVLLGVPRVLALIGHGDDTEDAVRAIADGYHAAVNETLAEVLQTLRGESLRLFDGAVLGGGDDE